MWFPGERASSSILFKINTNYKIQFNGTYLGLNKYCRRETGRIEGWKEEMHNEKKDKRFIDPFINFLYGHILSL